MAISQGLRRLLRIRELEEEQSRIALHAARTDLARLELFEKEALARNLRGRRLVASSAGGADSTDRRAGIEEIRAAERAAQAVQPRLAEARWRVATRQTEYLACRAQQRQVETLIREAEARMAAEAERKSQQALDDWFRHRRTSRNHGEEGDRCADSISAGDEGYEGGPSRKILES